MISIIICSKEKTLSTLIREDIAKTIGVDNQIVVIDNRNGDYNIFTAYQKGVEYAEGDILCFVHEDVIFRTPNWGEIVEQYFKEPDLGILGIAGTHFLPATPSAWWEPETVSKRIIQTGENHNEEIVEDNYKNVSNEVVAVDGVFLCIRKVLFNEIRWDSDYFNGFHGYDVDICLQAIDKGYKVRVAWDILIEHNSSGNYNKQFVESCQIIYNKWKHILPIERGIKLPEGEQQARTHLVEQKHIVYNLNCRIRSKEYLLGNFIFHPFEVIKRRLLLILKNKN